MNGKGVNIKVLFSDAILSLSLSLSLSSVCSLAIIH